MTEEKKYVVYEKKQKVETVILNRPGSLNALNTDLLTELRDSLQDAEADNEEAGNSKDKRVLFGWWVRTCNGM
jgi:enoyl-CoA hydratase/carnithine racemase